MGCEWTAFSASCCGLRCVWPRRLRCGMSRLALVAAVGDGRGAAAGPVHTGLRERPAVVAAAGQGEADRLHQAALVRAGPGPHPRRASVLVAGAGTEDLPARRKWRWCSGGRSGRRSIQVHGGRASTLPQLHRPRRTNSRSLRCLKSEGRRPTRSAMPVDVCVSSSFGPGKSWLIPGAPLCLGAGYEDCGHVVVGSGVR
jgi:hypothetical protein